MHGGGEPAEKPKTRLMRASKKEGGFIMSECCSMEIVTCKKLLFWKLFLVSIVMLIYSYLIVAIGYDFWLELLSSRYNIGPKVFNNAFVLSFAFWKIIVIQFTLIPALVLTWVEKELKGKKDE